MQSSKRVCPRLYRICVSSRLSRTCVSEHVKSRRPCVCFQHCSRLSTEAIPQPQVAGDDKQYSPKIQQIVHDISQLTLIETADLNDLLKKTLNIQDAPVMTYGGPAVAAPQQEEDEGPVKKEKTSFTVKLTKFEDGKKVQLIKEIKNLMEGMNLVQAKKFVESTPVVVKADIPKDEAEQLKAALVAAGGMAEVE